MLAGDVQFLFKNVYNITTGTTSSAVLSRHLKQPVEILKMLNFFDFHSCLGLQVRVYLKEDSTKKVFRHPDIQKWLCPVGQDLD